MLLKLLSSSLLITEDYIETVAKTASSRYKKFTIPKNCGGHRSIYQPARELKTLQRIIHDEILSKLQTHSAASAYKANSRLIDHASKHKNAKYLLRLDFKKFFESIREADISDFANNEFQKVFPSWTNSDTALLTQITCLNFHLTIGSVTSPALSNAICYELDEKISSLCSGLNITYTRYADDLYFSSTAENILINLPTKIKNITRGIRYPKSLWLNLDKTIHSSHKRSMKITGLTITNTGEISIGRDKKRKIKSLIHKWLTLPPERQKYLSGYLAYCSSVEPSFINNLCTKYGAQLISEIIKHN